MNLDKPLLGPAQVAELAQTDIVYLSVTGCCYRFRINSLANR
jgi:hypothetical protein